MGKINKREILLEWFAARAGDRIKDEDYQVLFPEFARMLVVGEEINTVKMFLIIWNT